MQKQEEGIPARRIYETRKPPPVRDESLFDQLTRKYRK